MGDLDWSVNKMQVREWHCVSSRSVYVGPRAWALAARPAQYSLSEFIYAALGWAAVKERGLFAQASVRASACTASRARSMMQEREQRVAHIAGGGKKAS